MVIESASPFPRNAPDVGAKVKRSLKVEALTDGDAVLSASSARWEAASSRGSLRTPQGSHSGIFVEYRWDVDEAATV
jgi:hypothetical protein